MRKYFSSPKLEVESQSKRYSKNMNGDKFTEQFYESLKNCADDKVQVCASKAKRTPEQLMKNLCLIHIRVQEKEYNLAVEAYENSVNEIKTICKEMKPTNIKPQKKLQSKLQNKLQNKLQKQSRNNEGLLSSMDKTVGWLKKKMSSSVQKIISSRNFFTSSQKQTIKSRATEKVEKTQKVAKHRQLQMEANQNFLKSQVILPYCTYLLKLITRCQQPFQLKAEKALLDFEQIWRRINLFKSMFKISQYTTTMLRYFQKQYHHLAVALIKLFDKDIKYFYPPISSSLHHYFQTINSKTEQSQSQSLSLSPPSSALLLHQSLSPPSSTLSPPSSTLSPPSSILHKYKEAPIPRDELKLLKLVEVQEILIQMENINEKINKVYSEKYNYAVIKSEKIKVVDFLQTNGSNFDIFYCLLQMGMKADKGRKAANDGIEFYEKIEKKLSENEGSIKNPEKDKIALNFKNLRKQTTNDYEHRQCFLDARKQT